MWLFQLNSEMKPLIDYLLLISFYSIMLQTELFECWRCSARVETCWQPSMLMIEVCRSCFYFHWRSCAPCPSVVLAWGYLWNSAFGSKCVSFGFFRWKIFGHLPRENPRPHSQFSRITFWPTISEVPRPCAWSGDQVWTVSAGSLTTSDSCWMSAS